MIRIVAQFLLKPGMFDQARSLGEELVKATRLEAGCIQYDLLQAEEDENHLVILENWASQEALDSHSASDHFKRLVPQLGGLCSTPPQVARYTQLV